MYIFISIYLKFKLCLVPRAPVIFMKKGSGGWHLLFLHFDVEIGGCFPASSKDLWFS